MRGSRETADSKSPAHPLHAAVLVCAIATPLLLAAWLEREPGSPPRPASIAPALALPTAAPVATPAARIEPPTEVSASVPVDPSQRARGDVRRLRQSGRFTLQFAVMCRDENVRQIVREVGADPQLYILDTAVEGRACHRVCYGAYGTADEASAQRAIPDPLRRLTSAPRPVSVAQVAP
jgi:septal ring-binding cell division protein DamX